MDLLGWSTLAAAVVAIPLVGFYLALRQDEVRWHREKRAELYIDLLAEAYAEREWMTRRLTEAEMGQLTADDEHGEDRMADWRQAADALPDTRMPPDERALLGARMAGYASPKVTRLFNDLTRVGVPLLAAPAHPAISRAQVGMAFDALENQIRTELRRSRRRWWERRARTST